jgi:hypothetical protein
MIPVDLFNERDEDVLHARQNGLHAHLTDGLGGKIVIDCRNGSGTVGGNDMKA